MIITLLRALIYTFPDEVRSPYNINPRFFQGGFTAVQALCGNSDFKGISLYISPAALPSVVGEMAICGMYVSHFTIKFKDDSESHGVNPETPRNILVRLYTRIQRMVYLPSHKSNTPSMAM